MDVWTSKIVQDTESAVIFVTFTKRRSFTVLTQAAHKNDAVIIWFVVFMFHRAPETLYHGRVLTIIIKAQSKLKPFRYARKTQVPQPK